MSVIELGLDAGQGYLRHRPGPALDAGPLDLARLAFPPDPVLNTARPMVPAAG